MTRLPRDESPNLTEEENLALLELINAIEAVEQGNGLQVGWARIAAAKDEVDALFFEKLDDEPPVVGTYPDGRSLNDGASDGNSIYDPPPEN